MWYYYYTHFADEEIEAQRGYINYRNMSWNQNLTLPVAL